jgi:AMMECR1 domain-containing protein
MPVAYDELKDIRIEISVLTEPKEISFTSAQGLLDKLRPFEHGVILHTPYGSSTYLPQVWQQLPAKEDFLSQLCLKHGAPEDYWVAHPENLRVEVYRAEHFQEAAYGGTG